MSEIKNVLAEVFICPETIELQKESSRETIFEATVTRFEFTGRILLIQSEGANCDTGRLTGRGANWVSERPARLPGGGGGNSKCNATWDKNRRSWQTPTGEIRLSEFRNGFADA